MTDTENVIFRPPFLFVASWLLFSAAMMWFGVGVVGPILSAPPWCICVFCTFAGGGLIVGVVLSFAKVRIDQIGLESRHLTKWTARWKDVQGWSQGGPQSQIRLKMLDGSSRSFSPWCLYGSRYNVMAAILTKRLGPCMGGTVETAPSWWVFVAAICACLVGCRQSSQPVTRESGEASVRVLPLAATNIQTAFELGIAALVDAGYPLDKGGFTIRMEGTGSSWEMRYLRVPRAMSGDCLVIIQNRNVRIVPQF